MNTTQKIVVAIVVTLMVVNWIDTRGRLNQCETKLTTATNGPSISDVYESLRGPEFTSSLKTTSMKAWSGLEDFWTEAGYSLRKELRALKHKYHSKS